MELSLEQLREEVDAVDAQLAVLLARRFSLARRIGERKARDGVVAHDPEREAVVAAKVLAAAGGDQRVAEVHGLVVVACRGEVERVAG